MANMTVQNMESETVAAFKQRVPAAESSAESARENGARRMADLLRRVGLTPPADFAEQLRSASSEAEAEDLVADQVQRFVNAVRAEAR